MAGRSFFDTPTVPRLMQVLEEVRTGRLRVPEFQRPFVWDDERRLLLLDSVAKGMPIGSFLVWRTRQHTLRTYPSLGPFALPEGPGEGELKTYLLDGHQRLSTLFASLNWTADEEAASAVLAKEDVRWPTYYELREQRFALHQRGRWSAPDTWLPLSILLSPRQLYAFQKTNLMDHGLDDEAERAEELATAFKDYQIPVVPLISEDLDLVTDTFVRVNSQGKPMHESYMVHALAYTAFDVRERLDVLRQRLAPLGWSALDDQVLLNALKARHGLDVHRAGPRELHKVLKDESGYGASLDELETNLTHAVRFLSSVHVRGAAALPYAYQLIALTEAARRLGGPLEGDFADDLRRWFWATTYTGYFGGMAANRIRDAIAHVVDLVCDGGAPYPSDMSRDVACLSRYNYQATRTRAFILLLLHTSGDQDAAEAFGQSGAQAVDRLLPACDSGDPANRVVITPRDLLDLRTVLEKPNALNQQTLLGILSGPDDYRALLERHVIPAPARALLRAGDAAEFLRMRRQSLLALEEKMVQDLDLTLMNED